jgi:Replication initiation factor
VSIQGLADPVPSASGCGATPHPTNRGVDSTERVDRPSEALIDWVEWTEHAATVDDVCGRLCDDWTEGDRGAMGYRRSRMAQGITVLYDGRAGMGVHVRIPGKACRALEASGGVTDWEVFLAGLLDGSRSITRLDVALDDRSGSVTVDRCYDELKAGHLVSKLRFGCAQEFFDALGATESRTLYFGSQKSDLRIRFYDKALEAKKPGPWTRVEIQTRDEHATALVRMLVVADSGSRAAAFGALLLWYLDFKQPGRDGNRSRWTTASWWSEFTQGALKRKLCLAPALLPSADQVLARLAQQYGPTMAALVEVIGFEPLFDAVEGSRSRQRGRHRRMVVQWRADE